MNEKKANAKVLLPILVFLIIYLGRIVSRFFRKFNFNHRILGS